MSEATEARPLDTEDQVRIVLVSNAFRRSPRVVDHRHQRGFEAARDRLSDAAHADHADGAAAQRADGQRIVCLGPLPGAEITIGVTPGAIFGLDLSAGGEPSADPDALHWFTIGGRLGFRF